MTRTGGFGAGVAITRTRRHRAGSEPRGGGSIRHPSLPRPMAALNPKKPRTRGNHGRARDAPRRADAAPLSVKHLFAIRTFPK